MALSHYVPEFTDRFLSLFPHRWDYLHADHPAPGLTPEWRTENRHPLSDRVIRQGAFLYGVRFGPNTKYALIDIDAKSIYHPRQDRYAISQIVQVLEPLGLCAYIACTSSYTGGLHLYFPLPNELPTWQLATAIATLLTEAGFHLEQGQLEVYPNTRNYDPENIALYKGHRLPLQRGSYLVGDDWQQCYTTPEIFCDRWEWCTSKNDIHPKVLKAALTAARSKHHRLSHRASKFLADLLADIDPGWTSHGQTNFLLGRIALKSYVFGHILEGCQPMKGDRLTMEIVAIATQLPGYAQWCRHQHEIWKRAEEWTRSVENSHYWHFRVKKRDQAQPEPEQQEQREPDQPTNNLWNDWQSQQARDKLRYAIADLLDRGSLPAGTRERFIILTQQYRLSGETLYRHRDLWHPDHLWKSPPDPPNSFESPYGNRLEGAFPQGEPPSLFTLNEGNASLREEYRRFVQSLTTIAGGNSPSDKGLSHFDDDREMNSG